MSLSVFITGMTMGLSLIVAIGSQNAFLLRQGLRNEHVFAVSLTCALSDAILIALGVAGFGTIIGMAPWLDPVMRYGGAAFLIFYGAANMRSALRSSETLASGNSAEKQSLKAAVLTCFALTWLNPHVYLDTVMLLGSISTQFSGFEFMFAAGAILASFLFFFSLGYGAKWLRPLFAKPSAWRILEAIIAFVMWGIAARLLIGL
ncbi:L-lysine exporter family protein LysE/ArgO [Pseudochrobactrum saccharolyticum]|uniref:L-lysine exporter family protein LysE/ArgO n=1 Tax=Pseudochrobactrum saccharolyticum TaxID=354352 RepID=A0A7W8AM93_9HYPH|nr:MULTISPECIES: LysE/ArgO family amino acid transporter [Pseudochrobactrum]KAB0537754.1 amino acid transporter [Pseudochrobactrum saccharolyticum]MBB5091856.1 L-lysine exporter family protein LysE/ArgO [Pseudochrobactrum saccharolyticum]MBX8785349.1 amino acid transporter [Ochrobactrum sp. GRS2]UCA44661.1 LysE/ArgO family amino acid transporter [Pseudochrobactrum sp. XF203]